VFNEMQSQGVPAAVVDGLKGSLDCSPELFGKTVTIPAMYLILGITIIVLVGAYILMNKFKKKRK
jgi:multidrug/hemolysin transport system permease protein